MNPETGKFTSEEECRTAKLAEIEKFLSTPIGARFVSTENHWNFVNVALQTFKLSFTADNLVYTVKELYARGYHALLVPTAEEAERQKQHEDGERNAREAEAARAAWNDPAAVKARAEKAAADAALAEKKLFESWWKQLPGENNFQTYQRANGLIEAYMRKKYPRAVPDPNAVHPDTARNTKQAIKMEQARAARQQQSYATPPIQPGNTGIPAQAVLRARQARDEERNKS